MALHKEYLPPTQSQNSNMFSVSIPKADTSLALVDKAAKCLAMSSFVAPFSRNQSRAVLALVMVSWVVNVLEAIRNKVVSGFTFLSVSAICVPSILETKCILRWFL
ncbi:hypothetical protein D3C87_1459960 [compost metagenome]